MQHVDSSAFAAWLICPFHPGRELLQAQSQMILNSDVTLRELPLEYQYDFSICFKTDSLSFDPIYRDDIAHIIMIAAFFAATLRWASKIFEMLISPWALSDCNFLCIQVLQAGCQKETSDLIAATADLREHECVPSHCCSLL